MKNHAFTLIEVLVVVLIIGILSAIALPQYQVSVYKSRLQGLMPIMRAIREAETEYKLANGSYTKDLDSLTINFPKGKACSGGSAVYANNYDVCVDYGGTFCAIDIPEDTAPQVICGTKDPLMLIRLTHPLSGLYWACWSTAEKPLTVRVCKAISGVDRANNGAHVFSDMRN